MLPVCSVTYVPLAHRHNVDIDCFKDHPFSWPVGERLYRVCRGICGLEEIADAIWNVYFGSVRLRRLTERHMRIEDGYGRLYRHHV